MTNNHLGELGGGGTQHTTTKRHKDNEGEPPHSLLSFLFLLLSSLLCWSYLPPQLKQATQRADLTLGPTEEAETLEEVQGDVARGQGWVVTCEHSSSAKQRAPFTFAVRIYPPSPSATCFLTSSSLTRFFTLSVMPNVNHLFV